MDASLAVAERRHWQRLPVAVPVFARGLDKHQKEFQEFTTTLDLSAGGALLAIRRFLPPSSKLLLEIPSPSLPGLDIQTKCVCAIQANVIRVIHGDRYDLWALRFTRPLLKKTKNTSTKPSIPVV